MPIGLGDGLGLGNGVGTLADSNRGAVVWQALSKIKAQINNP